MSRKTKPETPRSAASTPTPALSAAKQKVFWVGVLVLPVFILLGVEVALRLVGFGYPTNFFIRSETGPRGLFAENPKFGWRFFPQDLAGPASTGENEALGNVPNFCLRRIGRAGRSRTGLWVLTDSERAARGALSGNEVRGCQRGDDRDQLARDLAHRS